MNTIEVRRPKGPREYQQSPESSPSIARFPSKRVSKVWEAAGFQGYLRRPSAECFVLFSRRSPRLVMTLHPEDDPRQCPDMPPSRGLTTVNWLGCGMPDILTILPADSPSSSPSSPFSPSRPAPVPTTCSTSTFNGSKRQTFLSFPPLLNRAAGKQSRGSFHHIRMAI